MKKLIIAEKNSVGMEYARVLGVSGTSKNGYIENEQWIVTWAVGHLVTMSYPEKYDPSLKEWKLETLPFIPKKYRYEVIKETEHQFNVIKRLLNREDVSVIYYAGDSAREGLYIMMLIRQLAGHNPLAAERVVWIDSQTEDEILRGVSEAKALDEYQGMAESGYMRAIEDYDTGINFSRLLSVKYAVMLNSGSGQKNHKPISVGRVMSCVLGMIVKKEREIRNFKPTSFYRVASAFEIDGNKIECEWRETEGSQYYHSPKLYSEFGFRNKSDAKELVSGLDSMILITSISKSVERKNAPLLYNLAELQSECSKKLHISPAMTLKIAQGLYEKKLITYPRTDARVLTNAIAKDITKIFNGFMNKANYKDYVSEILRNSWTIKSKYVDDSKVTDHYAIIPTGKEAGDLDDKEAIVYDLVCRRFFAIFYPPAEYERAKIEITSGKEKFFGTSKYLFAPGYYAVSGYPEDETNSQETVESMNKLKQGDKYSSKYDIFEGSTAPPNRYTSGSIILAMENAGTLIEDDELREQIISNGIGTSATRADIVEKLIKLNYINVSDKKLVLTPSNFGEMVYEVIQSCIPEFLSPEITAKWEKQLDLIKDGSITRQQYEEQLTDYIEAVCEEVKGMNNNDEIIKKIYPFVSNKIQYEYKAFDPYNTKIRCPLCGDEVETTRWGFKCKSNISKTEGCTFAIGDIMGHRLLTNELAVLLHDGKVGPFYDFVSTKGKPFGAFLVWNVDLKKIEFDFVEMPWEKTELICPVCKKPIVKRGGFYKCSDYIDAENGCSFHIGKILGKTIPESQVKKLIDNKQTDLIKGFRKADGTIFDAFLLWSDQNSKIQFRFPEQSDLTTKLICPVCGGRILSTPYGFKCENNNSQDNSGEKGCSFFAGKFLGHTIKEKELQTIFSGKQTDLIQFKNAEKKTFEARMYWNAEEGRISLSFDDNESIETNMSCPLCGNRILKNKYGYYCKEHINRDEGCRFSIGAIAGVLLDEKQVMKLIQNGKTDLIDGFKPKEKGKKPFSAYLVLDKENGNISFDFPDRSEVREISNYYCPCCHKEKLIRTEYGYSCNCGFKLNNVIATKAIPEDQIRKLLIKGETDIISGFFSQRKRKMFSAKLIIASDGVEFKFPEK